MAYFEIDFLTSAQQHPLTIIWKSFMHVTTIWIVPNGMHEMMLPVFKKLGRSLIEKVHGTANLLKNC